MDKASAKAAGARASGPLSWLLQASRLISTPLLPTRPTIANLLTTLSSLPLPSPASSTGLQFRPPPPPPHLLSPSSSTTAAKVSTTYASFPHSSTFSSFIDHGFQLFHHYFDHLRQNSPTLPPPPPIFRSASFHHLNLSTTFSVFIHYHPPHTYTTI
jgi:hypothetical protein